MSAIRNLVMFMACYTAAVARSQQPATDPCATQKAEVRKLQQWVSYDRQGQKTTLAINEAKLAAANESLKQCRPASADVLTVNPASLTFPKQALSTTSVPLKVMVSVADPAKVQRIMCYPLDFQYDGDCIGLQNCTLTITFKPTEVGTRSGSLEIDAAWDHSYVTRHVKLSGTAVESM